MLKQSSLNEMQKPRIDKILFDQTADLFDNDQIGLKIFFDDLLDECDTDVRQLHYLLELYTPSKPADLSMTPPATQCTKESTCEMDWRLVDRYAHRLKGKASQVGFAALSGAASHAVILARSPHGNLCSAKCCQELSSIIKSIDVEMKEVIDFIHTYIQSRST